MITLGKRFSLTLTGVQEITTTPTHPFWVPQKGWTDAIELRAGDRLRLLNGEYVIVEQVQHEILESPITVYNFEVEDFHTYYVTDSAILVHNANCGNTERGIGGKGWKGDATWHQNIKTAQTVGDIRTINGQVLSSGEATRLIQAAGGEIIRGPEISYTGSHTYWHIHYNYGGIKHTIEVFPD